MYPALIYNKFKQFFFVLFKLCIVLCSFYFIYHKTVNNNTLRFPNFTKFLTESNIFLIKNIFFLSVLSFFNWVVEILKWQTLVSFIKKISFNSALEQSLGALTASLFTPNRIGEYGAKAIYYSINFRKPIMLINLISNFLQMSITTIFGFIGLMLFTIKYSPEMNYYKLFSCIFLGLIVILLLGVGLTKRKCNFQIFSLQKAKQFIRKYPKHKLINGFMLSLLRYVIFSFQYFVLLTIFQVNLTYFNAMIIITSMYLLSSIMPAFFIFDVAIKGSIAVYLFTMAGIDEFIILSTTAIMWILNFVIPSIFGSIYVINFSFPKKQD